MAADLTLLHSDKLVGGETAKAAHVVANFSQLITRSNLHESRVQIAEAYQVSNNARNDTNEAAISGNTAGLATVSGLISTNITDIATNAADIVTNAEDIDALSGHGDPFAILSTVASTYTLTAAELGVKSLLSVGGTPFQVITLDDPTTFDLGKSVVIYCSNSVTGCRVKTDDSDSDLYTQHAYLMYGEAIRVTVIDPPDIGVGYRWCVTGRGNANAGGLGHWVTKTGVDTLLEWERHVIGFVDGASYSLALPDLSATKPYGLTFTVICSGDTAHAVTVTPGTGNIFSPTLGATLTLDRGEVAQFQFMPQVTTGGGAKYVWMVKGQVT